MFMNKWRPVATRISCDIFFAQHNAVSKANAYLIKRKGNCEQRNFEKIHILIIGLQI